MIVCNWFPILLLSLLPIVSSAPTPSPVKQRDNLGAEISDVLLIEETIPPWGVIDESSSSQPPHLRFARSPWQQSMQWHPTENPRRGCYKRYDKRHRRWMRRACHYNSTSAIRRRRTTTTTTTTTTTPGPPTAPPKPRTKKRCFKRYHKKYKKYVSRCVYW